MRCSASSRPGSPSSSGSSSSWRSRASTPRGAAPRRRRRSSPAVRDGPVLPAAARERFGRARLLRAHRRPPGVAGDGGRHARRQGQSVGRRHVPDSAGPIRDSLRAGGLREMARPALRPRGGPTERPRRRGRDPMPLWIVLFLSAAIIFVFMLFFADSAEHAVVQATMMGGVAVVITSTAAPAVVPRQPVPRRGRWPRGPSRWSERSTSSSRQRPWSASTRSLATPRGSRLRQRLTLRRTAQSTVARAEHWIEPSLDRPARP